MEDGEGAAYVGCSQWSGIPNRGGQPRADLAPTHPLTHLAFDTGLEVWVAGYCPGLTFSVNLINTLLRSFH